MAKYLTTLFMIYKQVNKENIVGIMIAKTIIETNLIPRCKIHKVVIGNNTIS